MNKENIDKLTSVEYARATEFSPIVRIYPKISRNAVCPTSGKKFKHCCGKLNQDFCEKAKDTLKEYLLKIADERENNEKKENSKK
jgi:hypothetical protein